MLFFCQPKAETQNLFQFVKYLSEFSQIKQKWFLAITIMTQELIRNCLHLST